MSRYLVTGSAGFIGFHVTNALLQTGAEVTGLDNINDYYDVNLKYARLNELGIEQNLFRLDSLIVSKKYPDYRFIRMSIEDKAGLLNLFNTGEFDYVIHLAAQAGVRYSLENPDAYIRSNLIGFYNIIEACRQYPVKFLLYASSSSVYGNNIKVPFSEGDNVDSPISLYAATKKSNELMAFTYSHLYKIPATGLRFFTVYGPWGRPDMAVYKFTEAIIKNKPVQVYAGGQLQRDFTYIDDIVGGIMSILKEQKNTPPSLILNIGNNNPVTVNSLISEIEVCLDKKAIIEFKEMQKGDVDKTFADITLINSYCGFTPQTSLKNGIRKFCNWYLRYNPELDFTDYEDKFF